MKDHYSPIFQNDKAKVITILVWVPVAKLYKFELLDDGCLMYTPVIQ
jgi:hypothetical protein